MWLLSNKILVKDSGLMDGFRDYHCHLLPGVDDGVQKTNESMQILKEWESLGVSDVWMTPHIMEDIPNEPDNLKNVFRDFTEQYDGKIKLHLAAEHMMDGLFQNRLEENNVMPIGNERKYLLLETSYYIPPMNMEGITDMVRRKGYEPILAHPERYQYMNAADYRHWKEKDVLMQLNIPSLVGAYGLEVQAKARYLLNKGMYDYCGTDTHSYHFMKCFLNSKIEKKIVKSIRRLYYST